MGHDPARSGYRAGRKTATTFRVVGVEVQDHLIVGGGRHFSFRDAGLLEG